MQRVRVLFVSGSGALTAAYAGTYADDSFIYSKSSPHHTSAAFCRSAEAEKVWQKSIGAGRPRMVRVSAAPDAHAIQTIRDRDSQTNVSSSSSSSTESATTAAPESKTLPYPQRKKRAANAGLTVYFIRHAESSNNALGRELSSRGAPRSEYLKLRSDDPSLSSVGFMQADALVDRMEKELGFAAEDCNVDALDVAQVWCSPMRRTCETIQPLVDATGVRTIVDPTLYEMHGPFLADADGMPVEQSGTTAASIASMFPGYDVSQVHPKGWFYDQKFETHAECKLRAANLLSRIRSEAARLGALAQEAESRGLRFPEHKLIIVSHGNFLAEVLKNLMRGNAGSDDAVGLSLGNASVTKVTFWEDAIGIDCVFDTSHLSAIGDFLVTGDALKGMYVGSPDENCDAEGEMGLL